MAIYTRRGDRGTTQIHGEARKRRKDDPRIVALGAIDETNSALGLVSSFLTHRAGGPRGPEADRKLQGIIIRLQKDLFEIAAELATPPQEKPPFLLGPEKARELEKLIDELEGKLPVLANFIFPGGTPAAAGLHLARSISRRAERAVVGLSGKERVNPNILVYLNRLSDALFMLAREANRKAKTKEEIWRGK